ncbi:DUF2845 domain-containing protein [Flavobacteriales bacterium]|nr:DUF2845 domain-containing protein [Flavobacteriales bacterium]
MLSPNNCYSQYVGRKNRKAEKQRFDKNFLISPGMSKSEVLDIMGQPVASEFEKNVEEWHYCATGVGSDEFVSFFFFSFVYGLTDYIWDKGNKRNTFIPSLHAI